MSFYMITYGLAEIEAVYIGRTKEEVILNARPLIDEWHEYTSLTNEEVRELAEAGELEFDLVQIDAAWPGAKWDIAEMIALYEGRKA